MNKPSIKIIKRCAETASVTGNESKNTDCSLKVARRTKREMVKTIAGWIDERREQNRLAEILASQIVSSKTLASKD